MPPIRRLHLSLLLAGLAVAAAVPAAPINEVTWEYFADKNHTVLIGERILSCGGGVRRWGKTTGPNFLKSEDSCGKRIRTSDTRLAHLFLHHDPYYACTHRCDIAFPLKECGRDEDCGAGKQECLQGCEELIQTEPVDEPAAVTAPAPAVAPEPEASTR